jgi:hypothetical protein
MGSGGIMGDRSYIQITSKDFKTPISLYGHWSGTDNLEAVKNVLARTGRIGDPSYLTAQIFYEFAKLGNYDGELSFGIDAFGNEPDKPAFMSFGNNNHVVYVDADSGEYTYKGITHDEFSKLKV